MNTKDYDILICGAGPAGCTAAYQLSGKGLRIALLDKDQFPRDKICGDALSADVINQLYRIDTILSEDFKNFRSKKPSHGVRFYAPNGSHLDIDFVNKKHHEAAGYIAKRYDFDSFYFNKIKELEDIDIFQNHKILDVKLEPNSVYVTTEACDFNATLVIGADGANSIINRKLSKNTFDKRHHCAGLRQYYTNVSGLHPNSHIELHFYKELLPGYFWIFPLPNNQANVGLGMLSSEVSKQKINLKKKLADILQKHPNIKERFEYAEPLEIAQGFGLPIGSKKKQLSGNRFLLLGDAANLIDPFTGEGIGNAIRSGRIAAEHALKAFEKNLFDAEFNKNYDREIYQKMWKELRISRSMQMLLYYPRIFNFVVRKASKNKSIRTLLTSMLDNVDLKKELLKPSFYFKLIFN
jgi:geranylgeranyl reductase family protein